tara:strand:- start:1555 stop:1725 length:171 start_codon:yes stop_codon:yes gene_type:complete
VWLIEGEAEVGRDVKEAAVSEAGRNAELVKALIDWPTTPVIYNAIDPNDERNSCEF